MGVNTNINLNQQEPAGGQSLSIIWIVVAGLGIIFGGILIATITPSIFPQQASAEAVQVDNLFRFMLAIGGSIFLLVVGVLVFVIVRFRARPGDLADGPPIHGNTTLEMVWTIIPAIIVIVLTIYSFQVWVSIRTLQPIHNSVAAVGQRFAWAFNYVITPDDLPTSVTLEQLDEPIRAAVTSDGGMNFSSAQLHTWVGQQMQISLRTEDVNHAFWIPAMRIKQDLLAGRETSISFTPIEAGTYRIICAELCGAGHGEMAGTVGFNGELLGAWLVVHPDEAAYLREFYEPEAAKVLFPPEDPALLGRQILSGATYPCATCHVLDDLGWVGNIGPNLNNIGVRAATRVSGLSAVEYLRNSIRHPGDYLVPGYSNLMPQFNDAPEEANYMPDADLEPIVAYLLEQQQ